MNRKGGIGQVVELNKAVVGLDTVLHGNRQQLAEHRHALEGLAAVGGDGLGNDLRRSRIAQIADQNRAGATTNCVQMAGSRVVSGNLSVCTLGGHVENAAHRIDRGAEQRKNEGHAVQGA